MIISVNSVAANDNTTIDLASQQHENMQANTNSDKISVCDEQNKLSDASSDLREKIVTADNEAIIIINPGTYTLQNIYITKNITLQGNGDPRDIIIDGENKSSIFLIRSPDIYASFKNITFINGLTDNFGGAISIETGHVTVDNCMFINNTALSNTNAGGISNYGTKENRGYLLVNNSLFVNNHADHDGGAITTCYADSYIYNCVFINNSAHRDGGAIRVSVYGYGDVEDCIFMFNHADEWGGAYYSWSGESNIERCIFMNNTGGTNGGAVMVSGDINIEDSIITNNEGGETGGSFYIQQPMYNKKTVINVHNNLITNNSSPYGQEVFIKWKDADNLYTQFDNNDWGDEDPNDSSVIDPDNVTPRSKVSSTVKTNLFAKLNVDLLTKYRDLLGDYYPDNSLDDLKKQFDDAKPSNYQNSNSHKSNSKNSFDKVKPEETQKVDSNSNTSTTTATISATSEAIETNNLNNAVMGNSSIVGDDKNAYELNKSKSVAKENTIDIRFFIAAIALVFILLYIGYRREKK